MEELGKIRVEIDGEYTDAVAYSKTVEYDPMTGEPVKETVIANGFDPMTGEKVYCAVESNGFDPMTGEPAYKLKKASVGASINSFVSEASSKIKDATASAVSSVSNEFSTEDKSSGKSKVNKTKLFTILGIAVGAIALVAIILFSVYNSGAFLSKSDKIALATIKTINDDTIGNTLIKSAEILGSGDINTSLDVDINAGSYSGSYNGNFSMNLDNAEFYADGRIEYGGIDQTVQFFSNDKKIQVAAPDLLSSVYEYDFTKKNDGGMLADFIESNTQGDIKDVNELLKASTSYIKKSDSYKAAQSSAIRKALKDFDIDKTDSEIVEIDGKDRKCKGYTIHINKKGIESLVKAVIAADKKAGDEYYEIISKHLENLTGETLPDKKDTYEDLLDEIESMDADESFDINVYLYKGMLAMIKAKEGSNSITIEFNGGDTRTSEMSLKIKEGSSKTTFKKKSSLDGKVETGTLDVDGEKIRYEYDPSTGDFIIRTTEATVLKGVYLVKGNNISFSTNIVSIASIKAEISKGAHIGSLKGNVVDVAQLSEDDISDLMYDIASVAGNLDLDLFY